MFDHHILLVLFIFAAYYANCFCKKVLASLKRIEIELALLTKPLTEASTISFYKIINGQKIPLEGKMDISIDENGELAIAIHDRAGNAAKVDGLPVWKLASEEFGTLELSEDGMSAKFNNLGKTGEVELEVSADADKGEGVKTISAKLFLVITPGEAVEIAISGRAVPKA